MEIQITLSYQMILVQFIINGRLDKHLSDMTGYVGSLKSPDILYYVMVE